jgi:hypothetical protein
MIWTARAVEFPLASTIQFYPKQPLDRVRWVAARHKERVLLRHPGRKLNDVDFLRAATHKHGEALLRMPVLNPECVLLPIPPDMPRGILTPWC